MDLQVILIFILALLTLNLLIVGFYLILVLKEFRQTVKKANIVLENVSSVTNAATSPIVSIVGMLGSVFEGMKTVKSIRSLFDSSDGKED